MVKIVTPTEKASTLCGIDRGNHDLSITIIFGSIEISINLTQRRQERKENS
jgi:hypothetical protein